MLWYFGTRSVNCEHGETKNKKNLKRSIPDLFFFDREDRIVGGRAYAVYSEKRRVIITVRGARIAVIILRVP